MECQNCELKQRQFYCENCLKQQCADSYLCESTELTFYVVCSHCDYKRNILPLTATRT